jgi:spore germination cell wall hydrolase CwlJ-like protein
MFKFTKVASIAAISVTLLAGGISADAGFASGLDQNNSAITVDTIKVDEAVLAADQEHILRIDADKVAASADKIPEIIFVPGVDERSPSPDNKQITPKSQANADSLAELVRNQDTGAALNAEGHCLAGAVYFESKGESLAGQLAVARVVMARAKSGRFPGSLCGVVYQKSQFSFVRGASMPNIDKGSQNWRNAVAVTKIALDNAWKSPVEGALFFHARRVSPGWRLTRLGTVDNHIFYR